MTKITEEVLDHIKSGLSLNAISRKTGFAKSTLYYHYKKLLGCKYVRPFFVISASETEGEIIGAFAADGGSCIKDNYRVAYFFGADEEGYARDFGELLEAYFHKKPFFYLTKKHNIIRTGHRSKSIYYFLRTYLDWNPPKTYSVKLKRLNLSADFLKGFLRGYLDCDGYVGPYGAQFVGVSKNMMYQINEILQKLGFTANISAYKNKNKNYAVCYFVRLRKAETIKLIEFIKPRNNKRKWGCPGSDRGHTHPKGVAYH